MSSTIDVVERKSFFAAMLGVGTFSFGLALIFCMVVYPRIAVSHHAVLDPDGFGQLGIGIWKHGCLCYDPDPSPSVNRGPLYPALIAFSLKLSGGRYPQALQILQSLLFGLTCMGVVAMTRLMRTGSLAVVAGLVCTVHPFLLWYTSRVWVETFATFLFTILCLATLRLLERPGFLRASLLGICIGAAALTKGLFIVFIPLLPLGLACLPCSRVPVRHALFVFVVSALVIAPWTARNYRITGHLIPVHVNAGFATLLGNTFVENWASTGLRLAELHARGAEQIKTMLEQYENLRTLPRSQREIETDRICAAVARKQWRENPSLLIKKLAFNAGMFWILGETRLKSAVISLFQLPILLLFLCCVLPKALTRQLNIGSYVIAALAMVYYGVHLPVIACARYSSVILPSLIAIVVSTWGFNNTRSSAPARVI